MAILPETRIQHLLGEKVKPMLNFCARLIALAMLFAAVQAQAHEQWADGSAIPSWVKSACCGPQDAHVIDSGDVSGPDAHGYYRVKDVGIPVPGDHVFDSQDGSTWVFYAPNLPPSQRYVYCLFLSRSF
jgi:hypothetical protein